MVVIAAFGLFVPVAVFACASCGCTLSSDWNSVNVKSSSDIKVDIRYDYLDQDQLRSAAGTISPQAASQILNNGDMQEVEQYTKNNYVTLDVAYSISEILGISVQLPYINRAHSTLGPCPTGRCRGWRRTVYVKNIEYWGRKNPIELPGLFAAAYLRRYCRP